MAKVKAIVAFGFFEDQRGHVSVDEGAEEIIDDAEAVRLAEAGIVEILGGVKASRQVKIETAEKKPDVETADKKVKK